MQIYAYLLKNNNFIKKFDKNLFFLLPYALRFLCRPQKQVSELRDMQSSETQLVNGISCMARKAGYCAKVLSDKELCVTLIADHTKPVIVCPM